MLLILRLLASDDIFANHSHCNSFERVSLIVERTLASLGGTSCQEHAVKKGIVLIIILAVVAQLFASGKVRIAVKDHILDSGELIIHAVAAGKPINLLCNQESPFCSAQAPGEYWMVDWTVPEIEHRGAYVCRDVNLYTIAADPREEPEGRRVLPGGT